MHVFLSMADKYGVQTRVTAELFDWLLAREISHLVPC